MHGKASPVSTSLRDGILLVMLDNPPVNALSAAVRAGLLDAMRAAHCDDAVKGVVIACTGRTFIAGADINEFGKPRVPPSLAEVCDAIEACSKPVVAAIHGTALGGGFEVALAAHFRVATPDAQVGLPEVTLGLIPGAGGANRLTRLIGAEDALRITLGGKKVSAANALKFGAIDAVVEGEPAEIGLAFARRIRAQGADAVPTRARTDKVTKQDLDAFDQLAADLTKRLRGQEAPAACVASVRRALTLPFDEAIAADRDDFARLVAGVQSKALRHAFFAERQATRDIDAAALPVRKAAVLGAGTMGGGIAMCFAAVGIPVTLIDTSAEAVERGLDRIRANYGTSIKRGSIGESEAARRLVLITTATERAAAADADLVIEAVFEDMTLKKEIFADLEAIVAPDTVLASNTSALDVDEIAAALTRPGRFVGMHFFSPANVMRLMEVVVANTTSPETIATAAAVGKAIGKVPVVAGNCDGFIGNRMVAKRSAQAEYLLQEGALPQDVDAAIRAFGFAMGPLETNDMSGLDVGYSIRKRRGTKFPIADAIAESGRLGQKTGAGYYRYEPGSRTPIPDPDTEALIVATSAALGAVRRKIDREEMTDRMVLALVNEGARILEDGIAARASDIDVVWIHGYGFPRWRGGPMFYADQLGLPQVAARLTELARRTGDSSLEPAPLILKLAARGGSFSGWQRPQH